MAGGADAEIIVTCSLSADHKQPVGRLQRTSLSTIFSDLDYLHVSHPKPVIEGLFGDL